MYVRILPHREFRRLVLDNLYDTSKVRPKQREFARRNLSHMVVSWKRKLLQLVEEKHVTGWDDPRMSTISGMRRRGFTRHLSEILLKLSELQNVII